MLRQKDSLILILLLLWATIFTSTLVNADDVAAATSEDLMQFDRALQKANQPKKADQPEVPKKAKSENFGKQVSAEAKKLRESDSAQRSQMGKWVSGQRKNDDHANPSASVGASSSGSGKNNAGGIGHTSAPGIGKRNGGKTNK